MAVISPIAVAINASAIPGATASNVAPPEERPLKELIIPQTVPNNPPTAAPTVESARHPCLGLRNVLPRPQFRRKTNHEQYEPSAVVLEEPSRDGELRPSEPLLA
jgi:hypothetical protein